MVTRGKGNLFWKKKHESPYPLYPPTLAITVTLQMYQCQAAQLMLQLRKQKNSQGKPIVFVRKGPNFIGASLLGDGKAIVL